MILFMVLLLIAGVILAMVSGVAILLIEPIVCVLICYGIYRLIKLIFGKKH